MRILIIEDEPDLRNSIVDYLQQSGFSCESAADFRTAMEKISGHEYTCIIVDIGLPDGSGWHLLKRAGRALCPCAIAISGFDSPQDLADSAAAGFCRHLVKPIQAADLIAALEDAAATLPPPADQTGSHLRRRTGSLQR